MPVEYPNESNEEKVEAIIRAMVQAVPFVGGPLAELVNAFLSVAEERKRAWGEEISFVVSNLARDLQLMPQALADNQRFVSVLIQATTLAYKNHQKEKLQALKSAVVSAADERFEDDDVFIFLRYVDELTPTHLRVLSILEAQTPKLQDLTKLEDVYGVVKHELASLDRTLFRLCVRDLSNRSLLVFDDLDDYPEYDTKREMIVTEQSTQRPLSLTQAGYAFLTFITQPLANAASEGR